MPTGGGGRPNELTQHAARPTATAEWRQHWPLVAASMAGLSFAAIAGASIGLFMEPLGREFGWSRAQITAGLTIYALAAVPLSPFIGALVDRWGARRLAIPGIVLSSAAFSSFSLADGSTVRWLGLWTFYAVVALAIKNVVWTTAVSSVFTTARGLAVAFTLSGSAIAQIFAPVASQWLIDAFGWRQAYVYLGVGWGLIVLALLIPFFFDARDRRRATSAASTAQISNLPGLTMHEAMRSPTVVRIACATLIVVFILTALSVHLVPILGERGISREGAALTAAFAGTMAIVGRLATGWMNDRWASGAVGAVSLALPAAGCLLLVLAGARVPLILLGVAVLGYANGAFMQVCAYLTGRYAGMRNFGKIFGIMASMVAFGVGFGPVAAGLVFDHAGDYAPLLWGAIPATLASGLLVLGLGPYPDWQDQGGTGTQGE